MTTALDAAPSDAVDHPIDGVVSDAEEPERSFIDLLPDYEVTSSNFNNAARMTQPQRAHAPRKVAAVRNHLSKSLAAGPRWSGGFPPQLHA